MTSEQRFDQLLKASLDWQASRASVRQPSLRQATKRLAVRIAPPTTVLRPRLTLSPATLGTFNLLTLVLLLLALLAVALYVGAQLLKPPPFLAPERLGFAVDCPIPRSGGLAFDDPNTETLLFVVAEDGPDDGIESDLVSLYANGRLVQDVSVPGETRVDNVTGSEVAVRRLAPSGVDLLLQRVVDAGLTPGCRMLTSQESHGVITARTEDGPTDVSWGPVSSSTSYLLSEEEESLLEDLAVALAHPEAWLPEDAWIEAAERRLRPDHWLIYLVLRPTNHQPTDTVTLPSGDVLDGTDTRGDLIDLPGGAGPEEFGVELPDVEPRGPGSTLRCASASLEESVLLAASLEMLANGRGMGTDGEGDIFTEDLSRTISFAIQPVYGTGYDCDALAVTWGSLIEPTPTTSPPPIAGTLATIDLCSLLPEGSAAILGADASELRRSQLPMGVPAAACVVFDSTVPSDFPDDLVNPLPAGHRATVSLYPSNVDEVTAGEVARAVFGDGFIDELFGGKPVWIKACRAPPSPMACNDTVAGWSDSHLLFFEFTAAAELDPSPSAEPGTFVALVTRETAYQFVEAVLGSVGD